jgi:hypothetical protein
MTYCKAYIEKYEKDGNFCEVDKSEECRLKGYLKIRDELASIGVNKDDVYEYLSVFASRDMQGLEGEQRKRALQIVADKIREKRKVTSTQFFVKPQKPRAESHASNAPVGQPDAGAAAKQFFRTLPPTMQEKIKMLQAQEDTDLEDILEIIIGMGIESLIKDLEGT